MAGPISVSCVTSRYGRLNTITQGPNCTPTREKRPSRAQGSRARIAAARVRAPQRLGLAAGQYMYGESGNRSQLLW